MGKTREWGGGGEKEHSECVAGSGHEQVGMSAMALLLDRLFSYHLFFKKWIDSFRVISCSNIVEIIFLLKLYRFFSCYFFPGNYSYFLNCI